MNNGQRLLDPASVAERIDDAIKGRNPFALIRLGDGEGALLGLDANARLEDYNYLSNHFGGWATADIIRRVQSNLIRAIETADLIGIRDDVWFADESASELNPDKDDFLERFKRAFPLRHAETFTIDAHAARRIYFLWRWMQEAQKLLSQKACSQWVVADLQLRGYWENLIASQSSIGLIHHSPALAERLKTRFGVAVTYVQVPNNSIDPGRAGPPPAWCEQHSVVWPEIAQGIPANLQSQVFFVAAGLIGKHYCAVVKSNGGVAIDIGAQADAWDGLGTRGLVYASKAPRTCSRFAPPQEFQLGWRGPFGNHRGEDKRLVVHLGFSKTGTTSIQTCLARSEAALAAVRVHYVRAGRMSGADINHHELARALGMGERPYDEPPPPAQLELARRLLQEISHEIASTDFSTYVLSSELFTNFCMERSTEDLFVGWLRAHNVEVVLYARNQFDWLESWYTQAAKNGNMGLWLDEFLEDPFRLPNSERFDGNFLRKILIIEKWVGKPNLRVVSYDLERSLVGGFLARLGAAATDEEEMVRENSRLQDCHLMEPILRRRLGLIGEDQVNLMSVSETLIDRAFLRGAFAHKREELRKVVMDRYRDVNTELEQRFGVRF